MRTLGELWRLLTWGRCRCHARRYPLGPRCQGVSGHDGLHYTWSGYAEIEHFG